MKAGARVGSSGALAGAGAAGAGAGLGPRGSTPDSPSTRRNERTGQRASSSNTSTSPTFRSRTGRPFLSRTTRSRVTTAVAAPKAGAGGSGGRSCGMTTGAGNATTPSTARNDATARRDTRPSGNEQGACVRSRCASTRAAILYFPGATPPSAHRPRRPGRPRRGAPAAGAARGAAARRRGRAPRTGARAPGTPAAPGADRGDRSLPGRGRSGRPCVPRAHAAHGADLGPPGDAVRVLRLWNALLPERRGGPRGRSGVRADPRRGADRGQRPAPALLPRPRPALPDPRAHHAGERPPPVRPALAPHPARRTAPGEDRRLAAGGHTEGRGAAPALLRSGQSRGVRGSEGPGVSFPGCEEIDEDPCVPGPRDVRDR